MIENMMSSSAYLIPGMLTRNTQLKITKDIVLDVICNILNIDKEDVFNKNREWQFVLARHIYCYYLRDHFNYSLHECGKIINRDHATVLNSYKNYINLNNTDKKYTVLFDKIKSEVNKSVYCVNKINLNKYTNEFYQKIHRRPKK